jgi:hypothetical protein
MPEFFTYLSLPATGEPETSAPVEVRVPVAGFTETLAEELVGTPPITPSTTGIWFDLARTREEERRAAERDAKSIEGAPL